MKVFDSLSERLGAQLDSRFIQLVFGASRGRSRDHDEGALVRRLDEAAEFYAEPEHIEALFRAPQRGPSPSLERLKGLPGGELLELRWPSLYQPLHPRFADALERYPGNRTCVARWLRHRGDIAAPAVICLHGWGFGWPQLDMIAFRARWIYALGLDVLLVTLPFHAHRVGGRLNPAFPTNDPVRTVEGAAQAVSDTRSLVGSLGRWGTPRVGLAGMSLGAYVATLAATAEPEIAGLLAVIPFSSYPDLVWEHVSAGASMPESRAGLERQRFSRAFVAVDPCQRNTCVSGERMIFLAGAHDRVTPPSQALKLHQHFKGSRYVTYPGSHLLQRGLRAQLEHLEGLLGPRV